MLESDLVIAARLMYESQATNRLLFLDWPNEPAQMALYNTSMQQMFRDPTTEMYKISDESGNMIASLILNRKTPSKEKYVVAAPVAEKKSTGPTGINPDVRIVMRRALMGVQEPMEGIDHLGDYLNPVPLACLSEDLSDDFYDLVLSSIFVKVGSRTKGFWHMPCKAVSGTSSC